MKGLLHSGSNVSISTSLYRDKTFSLLRTIHTHTACILDDSGARNATFSPFLIRLNPKLARWGRKAALSGFKASVQCPGCSRALGSTKSPAFVRRLGEMRGF